jgi:hypothetical protein
MSISLAGPVSVPLRSFTSLAISTRNVARGIRPATVGSIFVNRTVRIRSLSSPSEARFAKRAGNLCSLIADNNETWMPLISDAPSKTSYHYLPNLPVRSWLCASALMAITTAMPSAREKSLVEVGTLHVRVSMPVWRRGHRGIVQIYAYASGFHLPRRALRTRQRATAFPRHRGLVSC